MIPWTDILVLMFLAFLLLIPLYLWGRLFYYGFGIDKLVLSIKEYFIGIKEHYFLIKEEIDSQDELSPYDVPFDFDGREPLGPPIPNSGTKEETLANLESSVTQ